MQTDALQYHEWSLGDSDALLEWLCLYICLAGKVSVDSKYSGRAFAEVQLPKWFYSNEIWDPSNTAAMKQWCLKPLFREAFTSPPFAWCHHLTEGCSGGYLTHYSYLGLLVEKLCPPWNMWRQREGCTWHRLQSPSLRSLGSRGKDGMGPLYSALIIPRGVQIQCLDSDPSQISVTPSGPL